VSNNLKIRQKNTKFRRIKVAWRQPARNATCPQPEDGDIEVSKQRLAAASEKRRLPPA
jgi:hypothetical protein